MAADHVQSPIALHLRNAEIDDASKPLEFVGHWDKVGGCAEMINTGTSAMITFPNRNNKAYIIGGPLRQKYILEQLHFHWGDCNDFGCEHLLDGNTYSMEAHFVHYNSKYKNFQEAVDKPDGLAVTGFFIQGAGEVDCGDFKKISDGIERIRGSGSKTRLAADCLSFLKTQELSKHYFSYKGSLTTPPYFTSVQWIVYRTPIYVSEKQIATFRSLCCSQGDGGVKCIVNNYRDIQQPVKAPKIIFTRNVLKSKL